MRGHGRIKMFLLDRLMNGLLMEIFDRVAEAITEVIPSAPCWCVATPEPLSGFVDAGFLFPCCWTASSLEVLVQDDLQ